jgi:hypothetical protein
VSPGKTDLNLFATLWRKLCEAFLTSYFGYYYTPSREIMQWLNKILEKIKKYLDRGREMWYIVHYL